MAESIVIVSAGNTRTLDCGLDGHRAELMRRQRAEVAEQPADRRACGGNDDDGV